VISRAAVREEGLTRQLVPLGFPAVADHRLTETLEEQAKTAGKQVSTGITLTLDAFYQGVEPFPHEKYKQAGVIAVEMEIAALYIIGTLRSIQTAAIVAIDGYADADLAKDYNPHTADVAAALEDGIRIALNALSSL
jgi:uridine phosphorylase